MRSVTKDSATGTRTRGSCALLRLKGKYVNHLHHSGCCDNYENNKLRYSPSFLLVHFPFLFHVKHRSIDMASKAAPNARPLHPCILSVFDGNQGSEWSSWAHITSKKHELPNLVTAQNSSLLVYSIDETSGTLLLEHSFTGLAGTICFLDCLRSPGDDPDSLLLGFSGNPRLVVVSITMATSKTLTSCRNMLMATSLLDLTSALLDTSLGSVHPLEKNIIVSKEQKNPNSVTLTIVLGGGISVLAVTLRRVKALNGTYTWNASEPYLIPLATLHASLKPAGEAALLAASNQNNPATNQQCLSHGFGEIISTCFLPGYLEPTVVLLHSDPQHGRVWSGRLGRPHGAGGTAYALKATAVTITVSHRRAAILWSVAVPADADTLYSIGKTGCLVVGPNEIFQIKNGGRLSNILAVNGWARSTCPAELLDQLQSNPWPLPRLAIQLDGSCVTFVNDSVALVSLRNGQLYSLQHAGNSWSMIPLGRTLRGVGEVGMMISLPFGSISKEVMQNMLGSKCSDSLSMGIAFVGSHMGDATLLGYTLESGVTLLDAAKIEGLKKRKMDNSEMNIKQEIGTETRDDEYEIMLRREEEALYAHIGDECLNEDKDVSSTPNLIPASSDDDENDMNSTDINRKRDRAKLVRISVVRSLTTLDSITALGPIGPGCEGPISATKTRMKSPEDILGQTKNPLIGSTAHVLPCGFGSSGGIAIVTTPGRDDSSILAEADCLNVQSVFSLPRHGLIIMGMVPNKYGVAGMSVLRLQSSISTHADQGSRQIADVEFDEVDLDAWCTSDEETEGTFADTRYVLTQATLLSASELNNDRFMLLVQSDDGFSHALVFFSESFGQLRVIDHTIVESLSGGALLSVTPPLTDSHDDIVSLGCVWSSGCATVATVDTFNNVKMTMILGTVNEQSENLGEDEEEFFYQSDRITAVDIFSAPPNIFACDNESSVIKLAANSDNIPEIAKNEDDEDEELELYGHHSFQVNVPKIDESVPVSVENESSTTSFIAIVRVSGLLQVFKVSDFADGDLPRPVWQAHGCGHGVAVLESHNNTECAPRKPRLHKVFTSEIRFFSCGTTVSPILSKRTQNRSASNSFFVAIETDSGDLHVYKREKGRTCVFGREPTRQSARPSKEQSRHHAKLRRKGVLAKTAKDESISDLVTFRHNRFHRFFGISGHDGLFAAIARPLWFVSERTALKMLHHRSKHVAPAGGRARPITGFCSGLQVCSFLTMTDSVAFCLFWDTLLTAFNLFAFVQESSKRLRGWFCYPARAYWKSGEPAPNNIQRVGVSTLSVPLPL